jgi:hypothetical protein
MKTEPLLLAILAAATALPASIPAQQAAKKPSRTSKASSTKIPEGVFYGLRTNLITGHVIKVYVTFLADGRAFAGYPKEGLGVPVNWERECSYAACGTYTKKGEQVVMHWKWKGEALPDETFRLDSKGVLHTTKAISTSYRRVKLLNGPLEGRYGIESSRENYTSTEITFSRDGKVSDERVLWWTSWDTESGGASSGGDAQVVRKGIYSIRKGTLRLKFEDGTSGARFIMVPPAGDVQKSVQIGGNADYGRIS